MLNEHLWLEQTLKQLNLSNDMNQPNGFTRLGYSAEERQAKEAFKSIAEELDLITYEDAAGNYWSIWKIDDTAPTIAMGSHLDTVYNGGGYDGVVGVLTALATVRFLQEKEFKPKKNIAIIVFSCEESARFGISTIGSKSLSGLLNKKDIANITDAGGTSIAEAINQYGLNWDNIGESSIPSGSIEQFIEVHIEQGKKLLEDKKEIGVVHSIARPTRFLITCRGMTNHTGTTEMKDRYDALSAIAPLINEVESMANRLNERNSSPIVATVSTLSLEPNAMNMIPSTVTLGVDIRSTNGNLKDELIKQIKEFIKKIEHTRQVAIEVNKIADDLPLELDRGVQKNLLQACKEVGVSSLIMNSGAGHDVMNMSHICESGLLFIPCKDGISHHPQEYTAISNISKGVKVLMQYVKNQTEKEVSNE